MLHPEHTQDVHNEALFLKVNKAIYGHKDAGFDFYVYLSSYLLSGATVALSLTPF